MSCKLWSSRVLPEAVDASQHAERVISLSHDTLVASNGSNLLYIIESKLDDIGWEEKSIKLNEDITRVSRHQNIKTFTKTQHNSPVQSIARLSYQDYDAIVSIDSGCNVICSTLGNFSSLLH